MRQFVSIIITQGMRGRPRGIVVCLWYRCSIPSLNSTTRSDRQDDYSVASTDHRKIPSLITKRHKIQLFLNVNEQSSY